MQEAINELIIMKEIKQMNVVYFLHDSASLINIYQKNG